jgi:TetR/AcrR family transcriptional regulator, transcriptional repressor for nem operon
MARPKEFDVNRTLAKAMDVFWTRGYEATSMQDLVTHLGVNRQSIYDTFGDKRGLFVAALENYAIQANTNIGGALSQPGHIRDVLHNLFETTADAAIQDNPRRGCMMVNTAIELAPHDPEIERRVKESLGNNEEHFYRALTVAQERGELNRDRDARALARFLNSTLQGLQVTAKANPDRATLGDIINTALSVLD